MIPETAIENCAACASGGGRITSNCRECMARYYSTIAVPQRAKYYLAAVKIHGQAYVDEFKKDVARWADRSRQ